MVRRLDEMQRQDRLARFNELQSRELQNIKAIKNSPSVTEVFSSSDRCDTNIADPLPTSYESAVEIPPSKQKISFLEITQVHCS